jgi:hypothetical protein
VAEVLSEQWCIVDNIINIISNNLSSSPHALVKTSSFVSNVGALAHEVDILGHVSWGTVVVLWDQVESVVPDAGGFAAAILGICLMEANIPHSWGQLHIRSRLNWVAEILREERWWVKCGSGWAFILARRITKVLSSVSTHSWFTLTWTGT